MNIREKMKLMYENPVVGWHEHVFFRSMTDLTLDEAFADRQAAAMEALGIDRMVVSNPVVSPKRCDPALFTAANDIVHEATLRHPGRYFGMAYVHGGHLREALHEIDRCVQDLGFLGIKLYYDYFMDDPIQSAIIEKCIDLDIPILMHSMRNMDAPNALRQPLCSTGIHMANAAKRYPEAVFLMGHFTISDWEYQLKAIAPYRNIYTDMSGSAYDMPQMEEAVEMLGAERILFATDCSITACVGKILGARIPTEAKKTILAGKAFERYFEKAGR